MRHKLNPNLERKRQYDAFIVYRDLGYGRTFREVSRIVEASSDTIGKWAKVYKWAERISQHSKAMVEKKKVGAILRMDDDPVAKKLVDAMDRIEAIIDGAFIREADGNLLPQIKIKSAEELTRLISEYRKFLETYHKFVAAYMPEDKKKDRGMQIKEFNLNMGDISQEERIDLMKGLLHGNDQGGNKRPAGGVQEADYTEVPGRGDEDGSGRDGVSGGAASGDSGDEEAL